MELTEEQIKKTLNTQLHPENIIQYLQCVECLKKGLPRDESVKSFMHQIGATYGFTYPDGTRAQILVLWCKRCGKSIWDSRHLQGWI